MRRKLFAALFFATLLPLHAWAALPTTATPSPSPSPSPVASPAFVPIPTMTPVPIPTPDANRAIACPHGIVCLAYSDGKEATVSCAVESTCLIELPNERLKTGSIIGIAASTDDHGVMQGQWSILPIEHGDAAFVGISPHVTSPVAHIIVVGSMRIYRFALVPDPAAVARVYSMLTPHNGVITIPSQPDTTYAVTPPHDLAALLPAPCPRAYTVTALNNPSFSALAYAIVDNALHVQFAASTALPTVGIPNDPGPHPPLDHLAIAPVAYDASGTTRIIQVLSCYPSILFFARDGRGTHALLFRASP
ncbi:MAG: hypothetical protein ACYDA1_00610 [Vulcanimicrobiaceae bacterium]